MEGTRQEIHRFNAKPSASGNFDGPWGQLQDAMIGIKNEYHEIKDCPHDYLTKEAQDKLAVLREFMGY